MHHGTDRDDRQPRSHSPVLPPRGETLWLRNELVCQSPICSRMPMVIFARPMVNRDCCVLVDHQTTRTTGRICETTMVNSEVRNEPTFDMDTGRAALDDWHRDGATDSPSRDFGV